MLAPRQAVGDRGRARLVRRAPAIALAWLAAALAGCAPKFHTIEPFRSDPVAARAIEARAREVCAEGPDGPRALPEKTFITDGCSLWMDDGWGNPCCVLHDVLYWCGGRAAERADADRELSRCVERHSSGFVGWLMWLGVRAGGHPIFPTWYRWGYGRNYLPWYGDHPAPATGASGDAACAPEAGGP